MFWFARRRAEAAERIEALVESDLDRAVEELSARRGRLDPDDEARLAGLVRSRLQAREHVEYLSRALAEGTISPAASLELLETYREAGYTTEAQFEMLRRHGYEAHRRELAELLASPIASSADYFRLLDTYERSGYLNRAELAELRDLVDHKVNPALAAQRLFATARTTLDLDLQEELLERYLMEFDGFPEYGEAASLYLALRIDQLWKRLPTVRYAREAAVAVHDFNGLLAAFLPFTGDLSTAVPFDRIVRDFLQLAGDFKPEPDVEGPITVKHLRRQVVVAMKKDAEEGSYEYERNQFVSVGAKGRVAAVRADRVCVIHQGKGLPYSRSWPQPEFKGSHFSQMHPDSSRACWDQDELGLVRHRTPSPVFVHQYREAVRRMGELLEQHREVRAGQPGERPSLPELGVP